MTWNNVSGIVRPSTRGHESFRGTNNLQEIQHILVQLLLHEKIIEDTQNRCTCLYFQRIRRRQKTEKFWYGMVFTFVFMYMVSCVPRFPVTFPVFKQLRLNVFLEISQLFF